MWYPSISKIYVKSAADLKAPAQGILISILTPMSVYNSELRQREFQHPKDREISRFLPVFSIYLCEGWKEKALLRRNSRTTLQYGEHCRSITPPDRKHSKEFIHELMQQHISYVYHTTLRENNLKCYPSKNIIHTQFRDRDVCVVSEWQFWMGFRTYSNRVELLLPLLTLTPAVSFPARAKQADCSAGVQIPTCFISKTSKNLPLLHRFRELGFTYLSEAEKNNNNRTLPLFASPDFEVWHKLRRD